MRSALLVLALLVATTPALAGDKQAAAKGGDAKSADKGADKAAAEADKPADAQAEAPKPPAEDENVSESDKERADKLFNEGRALMSDGNYQAACAKFAESQKLRPGIGVLFNLADCNEKIGKTGTAYRQFTEVVERTQAALQADREKVARERLAALEPKIMKIRIAVPSIAKVKTVKLDEEVIAPEYFNKLIPVDPGEHTVFAESPNDAGEPFEETVETSEPGKIVTVAIPVAPGAKMKRNVGMIVGGSISTGLGGLALLGAGVAAFASSEDPAPAIALGAIGVVGLGVGIPLIAVGAKKRPVKEGAIEAPALVASPVPDLVIGPTSAMATWHF
jgi:tetratricopeptide (TPR) repeat protein